MLDENTLDSFDLDLNSDDVADLVSYVLPPDGIHIYGLRFVGMDECWPGGPMGIRILYQKLATISKKQESDLDAANGSLMSESFSGNRMGKELLKKRLSQIFGDAWKGGAFRPYIESLQEQKMSAFHLQLETKIHKSKGKKEKSHITYENLRIQSCQPVACIELPANFEPFEYEPKEAE